MRPTTRTHDSTAAEHVGERPGGDAGEHRCAERRRVVGRGDLERQVETDATIRRHSSLRLPPPPFGRPTGEGRGRGGARASREGHRRRPRARPARARPCRGAGRGPRRRRGPRGRHAGSARRRGTGRTGGPRHPGSQPPAASSSASIDDPGRTEVCSQSSDPAAASMTPIACQVPGYGMAERVRRPARVGGERRKDAEDDARRPEGDRDGAGPVDAHAERPGRLVAASGGDGQPALVVPDGDPDSSAGGNHSRGRSSRSSICSLQHPAHRRRTAACPTRRTRRSRARR